MMDAGDDAPSALMRGLALAPPQPQPQQLVCAADLALERGLYAPEDAAASRPLFEARLAELGIHPVARRPADGAALYAPPLPPLLIVAGAGIWLRSAPPWRPTPWHTPEPAGWKRSRDDDDDAYAEDRAPRGARWTTP